MVAALCARAAGAEADAKPVAAAAASDDAALADYFRAPEYDGVTLSPSGRYLAAITRLNQIPEGRNIVVFDVDAASARTITGYDRNDVAWLLWASDDRIVFKLDHDYDAPGGQNMYQGMYAVRRDGRGGQRLDDPQLRERRGRGMPHVAVSVPREQVERVMGAPPSGRELLLTKRDLRSPEPEVYSLDLNRGGLTRLLTNGNDIRKWVADNHGRVRAAIGVAGADDPLRQVLWYRSDADADWERVLEFDLQDLSVLGFQRGDQRLLVATRIGRDRFVLAELDPTNGRFGEPLVQDPEYDVYHRGTSYLARAADGQLLFYQYMADKPRTVYFDKAWSVRQASLDLTLKDTVNTIVGWSEDWSRFLVYAWSDRQPGRYYLYEPARKRLEELLSARSWIAPDSMHEMRPISLRARDGAVLHGYLTLPDSTPRPPPLIIYPHDGPYGMRDSWGFDPDVQFLASRGYAVLQVNFRGSGGYGRKHERSGYKRWGLEMQDDISDAGAWVVGKGYADGQRSCIYGSGYGGYAALMGLVKTPKLYRCGIDYGGAVDLSLLYATNVPRGDSDMDAAARAWWRMTIGDPQADAERFFDTSPLFHVDQIDAPLLVIHGQMDDRVPIEHYRRLTKALENDGKTFQSMLEEHEGYGIHAVDNEVEVYGRIAAFLQQYLPRDAAAR